MRPRDRLADSLSLSLSLTHTHTHIHRDRQLEWETRNIKDREQKTRRKHR
jgi:hypothetical protein